MAERKFLLRAWIGLLACDVALRILPFGTVQRYCSRAAKSGAKPSFDPRRMAELVAAAGRNHLYPMTCLRRSLVLQRLLARHGIGSTLRLGVRKADRELQAHAWLEKDGQVLETGAEWSGFQTLRSSSPMPSKSGPNDR